MQVKDNLGYLGPNLQRHVGIHVHICSETIHCTKQSSSHKRYDIPISGENQGSFKSWNGEGKVSHSH